MKTLSIEHAGDVGIVWIDVPSQAQNTLVQDLKDDLESAMRRLRHNEATRAIVIASKKPGSFLAGADLRAIQSVASAEEAERRSRLAQAAFDELERSTKPIVAAIAGACLGGGLELALACHARVAAEGPKTRLGLPEVELGLLPGAGGTQRLPALIGLERALEMLLGGKPVDAVRAHAIGLVDELVPEPVLAEAAIRLARQLADTERPKRLVDRLSAIANELGDSIEGLTHVDALKELAIAKNPAGRMIAFDAAERAVERKSGDHYPAPLKILEVVRAGLERGRAAGLELESKRFGELAVSDVSRRLVELFFATNELKRERGTHRADAKPILVKKLGVVGAGLMGHGVAYVSAARAGVPVRMRDVDATAVGRGLDAVRTLADEQRALNRLSAGEHERLLASVTGTVDYSGFRRAELVIEAVTESLELKRRVLTEVIAAAGDGVIFASNTSSIPIAQLASASARPERVVGMHYFSPVHKMPLLEVVRHAASADEVVETAVELGKRQGKTVIVVNDGVGFYTTRVLGPYFSEAACMLVEGAAIEDVERAARRFGFPVGPFTLLDEVGLDTAHHVSRVLHEAFGDRLAPPPGLEAALQSGRLGRKGGRGFYRYAAGERGDVDASVYEALGLEPRPAGKADLDALADRLGLAMIAEAIRCLGEGVLRSPRDGDVGAILGLGFPAFRGGPIRAADAMGPSELLRRLRALADRHGKRWAPPELLSERARSGHRFYG